MACRRGGAAGGGGAVGLRPDRRRHRAKYSTIGDGYGAKLLQCVYGACTAHNGDGTAGHSRGGLPHGTYGDGVGCPAACHHRGPNRADALQCGGRE